MEGELDTVGNLSIGRVNGLCPLECPFSDRPCGTWCAHFSEPHYTKGFKTSAEEVYVYICHGRHWKFPQNQFVDNRGRAK